MPAPRSFRWLAALAAGGLPASLVACQWVAGLTAPVERVESGVGQTETEAAPTVTAPPVETSACGHLPPGPPDAGTGEAPNSQNYVFLIDSVNLTRLAENAFDLDCIDTCGNDAAPRQACIPLEGGAPRCDEPGGGDNAAYRFGDDRGIPLKLGQDKYREELESGRHAVLLFVQGYSGEADDPSVTVSFGRSEGNYGSDCSNGTLTSDDGGPDLVQRPPTFDGCDRYSPEALTVFGEIPKVVAPGYVTNYTLVVKGQTFPVWAPFGRRLGRAAGMYLEAKLSRPVIGNGLRIEGTVGGSARPEDILALIGEQTFQGNPFCLDPGWDDTRRIVCLSPDHGDAGAPCSRFSAGFGFTGVPTKLAQPRKFSIDTHCDGGIPDDAGADYIPEIFRCP